MQPTQDYFRYWIFQGIPERYDLADKLVRGETESWILTRYHDQVNPGDVIYFWRGGRQAGFYGWGKVTAPPYQDTVGKTNDAAWRVDVTYQHRFSDPIRRDDVLNSSQSVKLAGLLILRSPQGTNFKVTTHEAINLNRLVSERSEEAPEDPLGTGATRIPALSLAPLALGNTATRLVGAGIRLAENTNKEPLGGTELFSVLLALAVSSQGPPRGTTPFLREIFSGLKLPKEPLSALENPILFKDLPDYFISDEILDILESARLLAIHSTRREKIGVRHYLGGLLLAGRDRTLDHMETTGRSLGGSLQGLVEQFIDNTLKNFPKDDSSLWISRFRSGVQERLDLLTKRWVEKEAEEEKGSPSSYRKEYAPETKAQVFIEQEAVPSSEAADRAMAIVFSGRPVPDRPFGADLLQIQSEVAAIAHLFALCDADASQEANSNRATFALGLFGRWGSGKSFFIEKLKEEIKARSKIGSIGTAVYCKEIVQIDFNAWHYNEADIWASLVHHIFDTLQKQFQKQKKEKEFKNLIRRLEISQERREQLNQRIKEKKDERDKLEGKITTQESKVASLIDEQMQKISTLPERLIKDDAARKKLLELLPQAANLLGLPIKEMKERLEKGEQNAAELLTVLQGSGAIIGSNRTIAKTILRSGLSKLFLAGAGVVLLVYFALPVWLGSPSLWNDILSETGQIIALITPALIWLRTRMVKASNLFNQLAGVEAMLRENLRDEQEQKNSALVTLRAEHGRLSAEIEDDAEKLALMDQELLDLNGKLDDLGSAESLIDYINDRAASDDYRSKLGILALIRRDFEKLSDLMTSSSQGGSQEQLPQIDRIILYIDDLDRVQHSKKVLQVLEAVHLLLALPLFHVVVAVDERWATRSILSHHSDFFEIKAVHNNAANDSMSEGKTRLQGLIGTQQATPREFLEKIFQISFWVRTLSSQMAQELIEGVVTQENLNSLNETADIDFELQTGDEDEIDDLMPSAGADSEIQAEGSGLSAGAEAEDTSEKVDQPPAEAEITNVEPTSRKIDAEQSDEDSDNYKPTQINFEITEEELVSMRALASVVGRSPRTVKRFINTYRLFKAMNIPPGNGAWSEDGFEENRMVDHHVPIMLLLAVQVGYPDIAVRFFEYLDEALLADDSQPLGRVLDEMKKLQLENEREKHKWQHALDALLSVNDLYNEPSLLRDLNISVLNPWLIATSRFGFQEWKPRTDSSLTLLPNP